MPNELVFAAGCFDGFDGSDEELQDLIAELHRLNESGELDAQMIPVSEAEALELESIIASRPARH